MVYRQRLKDSQQYNGGFTMLEITKGFVGKVAAHCESYVDSCAHFTLMWPHDKLSRTLNIPLEVLQDSNGAVIDRYVNMSTFTNSVVILDIQEDYVRMLKLEEEDSIEEKKVIALMLFGSVLCEDGCVYILQSSKEYSSVFNSLPNSKLSFIRTLEKLGDNNIILVKVFGDNIISYRTVVGDSTSPVLDGVINNYRNQRVLGNLL